MGHMNRSARQYCHTVYYIILLYEGFENAHFKYCTGIWYREVETYFPEIAYLSRSSSSIRQRRMTWNHSSLLVVFGCRIVALLSEYVTKSLGTCTSASDSCRQLPSDAVTNRLYGVVCRPIATHWLLTLPWLSAWKGCTSVLANRPYTPPSARDAVTWYDN